MEPKIIYRHGIRRGIGPLGWWRQDEEVEIEGVLYIVTRVDLDGLAWAYPTDHYCNGGHVGYPAGQSITERQADQCRAIARAGQLAREAADA